MRAVAAVPAIFQLITWWLQAAEVAALAMVLTETERLAEMPRLIGAQAAVVALETTDWVAPAVPAS
jgi:hypothetical protein